MFTSEVAVLVGRRGGINTPDSSLCDQWNRHRQYAVSLPDSCLICGHSAFTLRYRMGGTNLFRCAHCGCVTRDEFGPPEQIRAQYSAPSYFSKGPDEGQYGYNNYLQDRHLYMWLFSERLAEIETLQPVGRFLDVGCATGVMLDLARLRGWEVQGVDISSFAVDIARKFYNLDVFEGNLEDASLPAASFDVVNMDDFIEHVPNPRTTLAEAARLLRPGGLLCLNTPNAASLTARLMGRHWFHFIQEEHYCFLTPQSARLLLHDLGFDVLRIGKSPRMIDLNYLFTRLGYYKLPFARWLLTPGRRLLTTRVGFFIYTGEMTVYARKHAEP